MQYRNTGSEACQGRGKKTCWNNRVKRIVFSNLFQKNSSFACISYQFQQFPNLSYQDIALSIITDSKSGRWHFRQRAFISLVQITAQKCFESQLWRHCCAGRMEGYIGMQSICTVQWRYGTSNRQIRRYESVRKYLDCALQRKRQP